MKSDRALPRLLFVVAAGCLTFFASGADQPSPDRVYTNRLETGVSLYADKKYSEAASYFETLTRDHPERGEAFLWLGQARANLKDWQAAREAYKRYVELAPKDAEGPRGVARTYEAEGQNELAVLWYQRARSIEPANAEIKAAIERLAAASTPDAAQPPPVKAAPSTAPPKPSEASRTTFWYVGLAGIVGARTVWWGRLIALFIFTLTLVNGSAMNGKMLNEKMPHVPASALMITTALGVSVSYVVWWGIPDGWRWALLGACVIVGVGAANFGARQAR